MEKVFPKILKEGSLQDNDVNPPFPLFKSLCIYSLLTLSKVTNYFQKNSIQNSAHALIMLTKEKAGFRV
jgi:hypothetical protein